jgi:acyl-CoA reductase-like NAD-dependent aldehyde dehydrogenase
VGAGNGPAYIHHSADLRHALGCILRSKTFDYGTVCASEQSIIVESAMEERVRREGAAMGFYFMDKNEAGALAKLLFRPTGALNPEIVGKSAENLAKMAGFPVPCGTKVLVAREQEAGPTRPYSMEKLCPVLAFFVMDGEDAVLQKAIEVLTHEGSGHTFAMHAEDEAVVRKFALQIPVSRFLVNTPAALGGIGASTGLFPALTLGCGAVGGSSSSNNISPLDLINIRRVAWDLEGCPQDQSVDADLVELLTQKLLERLENKTRY